MSRIGNFNEKTEKSNKEDNKHNYYLYHVIWRNWITPILLSTLFAVMTSVFFNEMNWSMFLGGQISMIVFQTIHKSFSI